MKKSEEAAAVNHITSNTSADKFRKFIACCKKFIAFLFSHVGLCCLVVAYSIMGGFIFMELEAPFEMHEKHHVDHTRKYHVEKLWNLTIDLNILYKENWTRKAEEILVKFQTDIFKATKEKGWDGKSSENELQWSFAGALLYSVTVITTIGYGHIAPKTDAGRAVTIIYAVVGIPLTLLCLANIGSFLANIFRFVYKRVCCGVCCILFKKNRNGVKKKRKGRPFLIRPRFRFLRRWTRRNVNGTHAVEAQPSAVVSSPEEEKPDVVTTPLNSDDAYINDPSLLKTIEEPEEFEEKVTVPITICILVMTGYIASGAVLFTIWEGWSFLVGSYFCFITLSTIGFGDFVPGTSVDSWSSQEKQILCTMYLLFGLAFIAMCFELMQEEVRSKFRWLARKIGLIGRNEEE